MATTPLTVGPVTMIGELDSAIVVEHEGRRTVVPRALVLAGSDVSKPGDRGCIVVPRELAYDLALFASRDGREDE